MPDEENEDHLLVDLSDDRDWVTPSITNAVNALLEVLYVEGCSVNPCEIMVSTIPGGPAIIHSDYGKVTILESEL
jgi:hypothetical protein